VNESILPSPKEVDGIEIVWSGALLSMLGICLEKSMFFDWFNGIL